jgi:hypothetical protein
MPKDGVRSSEEKGERDELKRRSISRGSLLVSQTTCRGAFYEQARPCFAPNRSEEARSRRTPA